MQQYSTIDRYPTTAWWRSSRASDSELRGPGFDPRKRHHALSLSKAHLLPTVLVKPRLCWLRLGMTEKLLTGTLSLNTKKPVFDILGLKIFKSLLQLVRKLKPNCYNVTVLLSKLSHLG